MKQKKRRFTLKTVLSIIGILLIGGAVFGWNSAPSWRLYFSNLVTGYTWETNAPYTEVSLTYYSTIALIPVYINGQGPFNFALDTGSPVIAIIENPHTESLGLKLGQTISIGGLGEGNDAQGSLVSNLSVKVGDIVLSNQKAINIPWNQLPFFETEEEVVIDGIIGYDIFRRFVVEFDVLNNRLRIFDPDTDPDWQGYESIPLTFSGRKPYVELPIVLPGGFETRVKVHVDTGKRRHFSLLPGSQEVIQTPKNSELIEGMGVSGKITSYLAPIPAVRFGSFTFENVPTEFRFTGVATANNRNGTVGFALLRRFVLAFDYANKRMLFKPREGTFDPFETKIP